MYHLKVIEGQGNIKSLGVGIVGHQRMHHSDRRKWSDKLAYFDNRFSILPTSVHFSKPFSFHDVC